jgi:hypothetical protein
MAVAIQVNELIAVWNGRQWAGKDASLVGLLNVFRDESRGYLPDEVNAVAMAERAIGKTGWKVIRSDPQPIQEGVIY